MIFVVNPTKSVIFTCTHIIPSGMSVLLRKSKDPYEFPDGSEYIVNLESFIMTEAMFEPVPLTVPSMNIIGPVS